MIAEQIQTGPAAVECLDDIATLRLEIFREFPYLYAGRRADELRYLQRYAQAPEAFVITVTDSGRTVGGATGMPLQHEDELLIQAFDGADYTVKEIYYVGELLLYPEYRGHGLGLRLVAQIEDYVRALRKYRYLTCVTVVRPADHPLRSAEYIPIDRFLARSGFMPVVDVTTCFDWREIDGVKCSHAMNFWFKDLVI